MATEYVSFFVRVPPELHGKIAELAKQRGQSISELARRALQAEVDRSSPSSRKKGNDRLATIDDVRRLIAEALAEKAETSSK